MAQFVRAWTTQAGGRVIGLTMSENASRVMAGDGMSEAHNIARFFARRIAVREGDALVVDEASQVSTADLARIVNLAYRAGARVILTGDTRQLGPVEAGGMFRLIAAEGERHQFAEVRRFDEARERKASLQLRAGDMAAWAEYGRRNSPSPPPTSRKTVAYAGNVFVAQGRTVDTTHLVVSEGMTRDLLYVGMTRGREENLAHVVTGPPDPADLSREERRAYTRAAIMRAAGLARNGDMQGALEVSLDPPEPEGMRERDTWESVIAAAMEHDDPAGTAIDAMRTAQEFPVHMRHLYEIREAYWWKDVVPQIDDMVRQRITWADYQRYLNDPERPAFLQELRRHEIGGRRIEDVLDSITAMPLDGARSIAAVLHGRAGKNQPRPGATRSPGLSAPATQTR
jgi:AAA domain